jgi:hypothetical protein
VKLNVVLPDDRKDRRFTVSIKFAAKVHLKELKGVFKILDFSRVMQLNQ